MRPTSRYLLAALFTISACKTSQTNPGSQVKDTADGTNWCHARFRSTDNTDISVDYNVSGGVATPAWINVKRPNGLNNEDVSVVVVPFSYTLGAAATQQTSPPAVQLTYSAADGKYTATVPGGLKLQDTSSGSATKYYYEFAFHVKSSCFIAWLVDPFRKDMAPPANHNFHADLAQINRQNHYVCGDKPAKPDLTPPPDGTTNEPLEKDAVLDAMHDLAHVYYDSADIYSKPYGMSGSTKLPPPKQDWKDCLSACPSYYSDIVCHYYCLTPSYQYVVPNVRGCFTSVVRSPGVLISGGGYRPLSYPEAYDYCVYQDFDAVLGRSPEYDPAIISANKASNTKPGVMKWIADNQEDVFKYLMWTFDSPFAFNTQDQQDVINAFYDVHLRNKSYGAGDTADVNECKSKRPIRPYYDSYDGTYCSYTKSQANLRHK